MGNVQMEARQIRYGSTNVEQALNNGGGGGGASTLAALTDTDISTPSNGQVLTYDSTSSKWENKAIPASAATLAALTDVDINDLEDGQILKYDATAGKWKNYTVPVRFVKATPNMTSANTPSGVVSESSNHGGQYAGWYAFCGTLGQNYNTWVSSENDVVGAWLMYQFPEATCIKKISVTNRTEANPRAIKVFKLQGSNDGTAFTDLATCTMLAGTSAYSQNFTIDNSTDYLYYRLLVVEAWLETETCVGLAALDLYVEESPI